MQLVGLHPEIKCKKPSFQYNLYQECGFLSLISRSADRCSVQLEAVAPFSHRRQQLRTQVLEGRGGREHELVEADVRLGESPPPQMLSNLDCEGVF
mmetsp:Transcript_15777/g.37385  ORF Transcript_15777/g.37385 Transcript_15777/m.37385 type:complete len:96 (+) Transcript_15777:74-361(+)